MTHETSSSKSVDVIVGSSRQEFWDTIQVVLKGFYPYKMKWVKSIDELMSISDANFKPVLALIDGHDGTGAASEWSQSTKMTYDQCAVLVLHTGATEINFDLVKKNGATEIMHLSFDREFISDMVLQLAPIEIEGDHIPITALMPVDLRDLEIDSEINFDIFVHMPSNQKTVLYRKAGAQIEGKCMDKFSKLNQNMYIKKTQMKAFFEYARTVLTMRNIAVPVSMTEKFQKSKKSIFNIMATFMNTASGDFQEGRKILAECISIVESFDLIKDQKPEEIFTEICRFAGNTRGYYHDAISVAAFAALFAQLLDMPIEKRTNAALAGLLHNIGLAQMPMSAAGKTLEQMTSTEKNAYIHYPERSVVMVKNKKVALSPEVAVAIEQHRELGDGSGFPKNLPAADIESFSKVLILAYKFHTLTALENHKAAHNPRSALKVLKDDAVSGLGQFDLVFTNQIYNKIGKS